MASIKLSVTVRSALVNKYSGGALSKIDIALAAWIAADLKRGLTTLHVALDDATAMAVHGCKAIKGRVSAAQAKRAIDALAARLQPDYIVIIGGQDVLPSFNVPNPSFDPKGDADTTVPTDNPYACARAFAAKTLKSYLVPDRVVGRIPDLPAPAGTGDPIWLLTALKTATTWTSKPRTFYAEAYATCCDEWKGAGQATMQYLGLPVADLMISPPTQDATALARNRLARSLQFTKGHGSPLDAHFYGQKGGSYPEVLVSTSVQSEVKPGTLAAAMCCYGAQVYAPTDPAARPVGALPVSMAYLRAGAVGFMGSTKIAWVGPQQMMCADWIVASYLKKSLEGASLGRALLEAKQDYLQYLANQGQAPDTADEKTMIEFMLLGDPSLHPVAVATPSVAAKPSRGAAKAKQTAHAALAAQRSGRRIARAAMAVQVRKSMPHRREEAAPTGAKARGLFDAVAGLLSERDVAALQPSRASASRLVAAAAPTASTASGESAVAAVRGRAQADSIEYTWTGRAETKAGSHIRLLKVQTDTEGNVLRSRLLHSA
jgi:hypothetical protein